MRLDLRQGIVSHQPGGFLRINISGNVDILANTKTLVTTLAHHDTNYLHSEDATTVDAWLGPFANPKTWLYLNFDLATFERTFGHTALEPVAQAIRPGAGGTDIQSAIVGSNNGGRFVVSGHFVLPHLRVLAVSGSTGNDGLYTVFSSEFNGLLNQTTIYVVEDVIDNTIDGQVSVEYDIDGLPLVTNGRMWYDTNNHVHYELMGSVWVEVLRVFAAQLLNSTTFVSHSMAGGTTFVGTQIGDTSSVLSGRTIFTENSNVIRRDDRTFLTTEDQLFSNQSRVDALRLESNVTRAKATESAIASFTTVAWTADGQVATAQYDHVGTTVVGMLTEDIFLNEIGAVIVQGVITNVNWNWTSGIDAIPVGSPLWVDNGSLVSENPHVTDVLTYKKSQVPVARVLDNDTIIFEQGLGGVGDTGPQGSVEFLPPADTVSIGAVTLVTPSSDSQRSLVISDTDPRLSDARTPSPHTHPAVDVLYTPSGGLTANNTQLALTELGTTKFNISGGSLTGALYLNSNPVIGLQAATKQYVDGLVSGLVWLDPVRMINLVSDNIITPPVSPVVSDAYVVPPGAIGVWSAIASGHVVVWDGTDWLDRGSITTIDQVSARFGITMQTTTVASGSFAGRDRNIVNYDASGNIDTFDVPTTNNAVFVNHTSSLHAFDQFAFDGSSWVLFGGAAAITADGITTTLSTNLMGVKQFDDGGVNDVSHWQGLVPSDLDASHSVIGHSHTAGELANTPYTTSLYWGTLTSPDTSQLSSITIQAALNELMDKKAAKQPAYATITDAPIANTTTGMTILTQDTNTLHYSDGSNWNAIAVVGGDLAIPYDITFSIAGTLQQDIVVGTFVSGRQITLSTNLPGSIAYTSLAAADSTYSFHIIHTPVSTGVAVEVGLANFSIGANFGTYSFVADVTLEPLDVLQIKTAQSIPPDSALQDVGLTVVGCSVTTQC